MMNNSNTGFVQSNWGYIFLIVATVGDLAVPFIIATFHDKYSHLIMVMSSIGDTKELNTISEKIHGYGSAIGFSILVFAPLIVAILSVKSNNLSMSIISFISFFLALAFFSLFILSDKDKFSNTIISYQGLWQRLSLMFMYAPITFLSLKKVFSLF